jgi:hypothetical protein
MSEEPVVTNDSCAIEERQRLLDVLCVKYGFCLSPLWRARLERNPPRSVEKFVDAVFRAEGLDPATADDQLYRTPVAEVERASRSERGK